MKRLTETDRYWEADAFWYDAKEPDVEDIEKIYNRLAAIEDILGDEYDLDRLRELAQADEEGRVRIKGKIYKCPKCKAFCLTPRLDNQFYYCFNCKTQFTREKAEAALRREQDG